MLDAAPLSQEYASMTRSVSPPVWVTDNLVAVVLWGKMWRWERTSIIGFIEAGTRENNRELAFGFRGLVLVAGNENPVVETPLLVLNH